MKITSDTGEAGNETMSSAGMAGPGELATKSDLADLGAGFVRLEARVMEFRAAFPAMANRMIFSQVAISAALLAALKLC